VDDAAGGVAAFAREFEPAVCVAVKGDGEFVEEQRLECGGAFADEVFDGGGVSGAVACGDNVGGEQLGLGGVFVNDTALCPVAIGGEWRVEAEHLDAEPGAGRMQCVGRAREARSDYEAVCMNNLQGL